MFIYNQLFTLVIFTTYFTVCAVYKMSCGNGKTEVKWNKYYNFIMLIGMTLSTGLLWAVYNTIGFFKRSPFTNYVGNFEKAMVLRASVFRTRYGSVIREIDTAFGITELVVRIILVVMLGNKLWEISILMKTSKSLRAVRKYKLWEWSVFILMCMVVSMCMGIVFISITIESVGEGSWIANNLIPVLLGQKEKDSIVKGGPGVSVGRYDIIIAIMNIIIGASLSFLAPCRKVTK